MVVLLMAKKIEKADEQAPRRSLKTGPRIPGVARRRTVVTIKGLDEWADWLSRYAAHKRVAMTQLLDQAVTAMARADNFEEPPKR